MSYERLVYGDPDTPATMTTDCDATARAMSLSLPHRASIAERALRPAPSIRFEDNAEQPKRAIEISEAAARLAARLNLG